MNFSFNHEVNVLERHSSLECRHRHRPRSVWHRASQTPFIDYDNAEDDEDVSSFEDNPDLMEAGEELRRQQAEQREKERRQNAPRGRGRRD